MYEFMTRLAELINETGHSENGVRLKVHDLGEYNEKFWNSELKNSFYGYLTKNDSRVGVFYI